MVVMSKAFYQSTILCLVIAGMLGVSDRSTVAQSRICYEVNDRDGWTNIRDRDSKKIVARIDNEQSFLAEGTTGDSLILDAPHNQFLIHKSRARVARTSTKCFRFTSIESDGYLNLRAALQGSILGRITNGTALLIVSKPKASWVRVLTEDGRTGLVHAPRLEVYN
jgi:hypothetical protein